MEANFEVQIHGAAQHGNFAAQRLDAAAYPLRRFSGVERRVGGASQPMTRGVSERLVRNDVIRDTIAYPLIELA